ncbi:hypothetical protein D3C85_1465190 [compost metagenome]
MQVVILSTYLMFTNLEKQKKSLVILYKAGEAILLSAQNIPEAAAPARQSVILEITVNPCARLLNKV